MNIQSKLMWIFNIKYFNTCMLGNFHAFSSSADIFQNQLFRKTLSGIPTECQTILDPYQARHFVRPDLGSNFLQKLSEEDT